MRDDLPSIDPFVDADTVPEWHAVFTIQLSELVETHMFDWSMPELDWSEAAYSDAQYKRLCDAFVQKFYWREISMLPPGQWYQQLRYKLVYELMPKYKPMYQAFDDGFNPYADSDEYHKRRTIGSEYPETLLSGNSDYISTGQDIEYETVKIGDIAAAAERYERGFKAVDAMLLDELESMFVCMYAANVNGW